ncbi:FtsQ-type POTRA domain-containing protein [Patescibacteria group bacterium]|nr:FtsQ-type POTRA domain-containing protein [Patescibacteria group bacterium]MBU4274465.1 FtsQ-type POTRA domain-containing protein [Patescibacteria group bacterium]MBU4367936.1 FtsQ-type POTRA domain-containing protein [Patescibacteria group bacterium]MBU4462274.1 FtsQ-type POTRA domain-containing protein [Patescibacteria group bacterium]MCG2699546.1 FtsQ-type POTRA domain-containing protein [Candidatus Parcubacteria bacterium]
MRKTHYKPHKIKPKKSIFKKHSFWFMFLSLSLITAGIYFLIFFKPLQINKIIISGNEKVQIKEIETLIAGNIKQRLWFATSQNILLVSTARINKSITERYPVIDSLKVQKKLPNTLVINIEERKPFAVFYYNEEYFLIDEKGVVFEKTSANVGGFFIVRQTGEIKEVILGTEIVKKEVMEKIAKIKRGLEERSQIDIKEVDIASGERLNVKTSEGWDAYFNLTTDIDLQIEKLNLLLENELPKENRAGLQYIDLRFKDRVYYK